MGMKINEAEMQHYAQAGMAHQLSGMQKLLDVMQDYVDDCRIQLAAMQGRASVKQRVVKAEKIVPTARDHVEAERNRDGKPITQGYWAEMTSEERSAEVRRRQKKSKVKKVLKTAAMSKPAVKITRKKPESGGLSRNHPSNPAHPGHKAWIKKIQAVKIRKAAERAQEANAA